MKRPNRAAAIFGAVILTAVAIVGGFSASATGGDQTDPLVTLSYLTQVVKPELLNKVDEKVAANEQALVGKVDAAIKEYSQKMEQALGGGGGDNSVYTVVALSAGELLCPDAGSDVLLRTGKAKVASGKVPVMIASTSGSTVSIGGVLVANHLYVTPLDSAVIMAESECTVLVRGGYTVV